MSSFKNRDGHYVRDLDSFEEFFFHMESVAPALHLHAIHLSGPTARGDWRAGWDKLHEVHPLLRVGIVKESGRRPIFIETERLTGITVTRWDDETLSTLCEATLARPFSDPSEAMVAMTVLHRPNECLAVLAAHHSLYDGMGTLLLLQDLLELVAGGETRANPPAWSSLRKEVGAPSRGGYRQVKQEAQTSGDEAPAAEPTPLPPVKVHHLAFDQSLTARLEVVARANGTTPHGVLMAAFQIAGGKAKPAWITEGVGCNTPHNVRGSTQEAQNMAGMLTMPLVTWLAPQKSRSFWDMARAARDGLAAPRSAEGRIAFVAAMDDLTADEMTSVEFLERVLRSPIRYDLMITDYASYRPRTRYGSLEVILIATGNNGGGPDTQTIGVCTLDGAMNLTQSTRQPIDGLLEDCRALVREVCA
jgi:hypothetical protein